MQVHVLVHACVCALSSQAQEYGGALTKWYHGVITSAPDDEGRCDVRYADGDEDIEVPSDFSL